MAASGVIVDPIESIVSEARRISVQIPGTTWYLFGSMLRNRERAQDIDLLVIHAYADDGPRLRCELAALIAGLPVHLLIVSEDEELTLNVLGRYELRQLFPPT